MVITLTERALCNTICRLAAQAVLMLTAILVLLATSCQGETKTVVLQLRWDNQFQFAGYYCAKWQGFYDAEGLNVLIKPAVTEAGIVSAIKEVAAGRVDFGIGASDILIERDKGTPLVVLASIFQHSAAGFFTRSDTTINKPSDFLKLKVARRVNDLIDVELQAMLLAEGIDPAGLKTYPHQAGIEHLMSGKVDVAPGYIISLPHDARMSGTAFNEFRPIRFGIDFYGDSLFTHNKTILHDQDLVEKFTRASLKGWQYAMDNRMAVIKRISQELDTQSERTDRLSFNTFQSEGVLKLMNYPEVQIGNMDPQRWERMHKYLSIVGILNNPLDINTFIFNAEKINQEKSRKRQIKLTYFSIFLVASISLALLWIAALRKSVKKQTLSLLETNRQIRASQEKYESFVENQADLVCQFLSDGTISYVNHVFCDFFGKTTGELVGSKWHPLPINQDINKVEEQLASLNPSTPVVTFENRVKSGNGNIHWIQFTNSGFFDDDGVLIEIQSVGRDITSLKLSLEKINQQNVLFNAISKIFQKSLTLETPSEVGKFCLSIAEELTGSQYGAIAKVSEGGKLSTVALSNLGWDKCEYIETGHDFIIEDIETHQGIWKTAFESKEGLVLNRPLKHQQSAGLPDGHPPLESFIAMPYVHSNMSIIIGLANKETDYTSLDKETLKALAIVFVEVIERKNQEQSLKNSEARYRDLFDLASDAILLINTDSMKIVDANRAAMKLYGYTYQEFCNLKVTDISAEIEKTKDVLQKSYPTLIPLRYHRKKDGTIFPVEITLSYFKVNDDKMSISVVRHIGDRLDSENERRMLESKLIKAQKMESIGNLAGGIAHDFNNILTVILGFTELGIESTERETELEDTLQEVLIAGKRAKDLVGQILAFARQSEEELKPVRLDSIIHEVVRFLRSSIPTTIEIKHNLTCDSLTLGNSTQLHQILMNLCVNAANAMEPDGGLLQIDLSETVIGKSSLGVESALTPGGYLLLSISDTGTGITPGIIDSIFEPYFTTKGLGEGTGMGLAVVHGIVETYGGEISVDSVMGEGTTFSIYLPITTKGHDGDKYTPADLPGGTENILFVDDEAAITRLAERMLTGLGYSVTTKLSSVDALELFRTTPYAFDLVITDMTMPNMTGDKLAVELLTIQPELPVIICTGFSKAISESSISELGIKGYVRKPLVKSDLALAIREVLDENSTI